MLILSFGPISLVP